MTKGLLQVDGLGPLERRVLEEVWRRHLDVSVRDVHAAIPDLAYTTLMTTLDRLHKKGLLERRRQGRAYLYAPRLTRDELRRERAAELFDGLLGADGAAARPVLSCLVDAVGQRDRDLLEELDRLVREKRRRLQRGEKP